MNNSNREKAIQNAKEKKSRIRKELEERGFNATQDKLEEEFDDLIKALEDKINYPDQYTENNIKEFKEKEYFPRTLLDLIAKDVYINQYRIHSAVKRINEREEQFEKIKELLKKLDSKQRTKESVKLNSIPNNHTMNWGTTSRARSRSLPNFRKFMKLPTMLTRRRGSMGGKRKNKTRKS